jgi:hypothetical protein
MMTEKFLEIAKKTKENWKTGVIPSWSEISFLTHIEHHCGSKEVHSLGYVDDIEDVVISLCRSIVGQNRGNFLYLCPTAKSGRFCKYVKKYLEPLGFQKLYDFQHIGNGKQSAVYGFTVNRQDVKILKKM